MADEEFITIPLTKGFSTTIDRSDYGRVAEFKWTADVHKDGKVYAYRADSSAGRRRKLYLHRFLVVTDAPTIDHRDGDGLNNRRDNLRPCSFSQNAMNKARSVRKPQHSKYPGVYWNPEKRKWQAQITILGKRIYLGRCREEFDAAMLWLFSVADDPDHEYKTSGLQRRRDL